MIDHQYRQVPISLVNSPRTARMTPFQFRFAVYAMMNSTERWELPFEADALLRIADPFDHLKARSQTIANVRDALLHAEIGFFLRGRFRGQPGLVIHEEFRRDTERKARAPAEQIELGLGAELSVLPPANGGLKRRTKVQIESPRPAATDGAKSDRADAKPNPWNRKEVEEKKGSRFAVPIEEMIRHPLGKRMMAFVGAAQMLQEAMVSGKEWLRIFAEESQSLSDLLEQGERSIADMPGGLSRAKFLTKRLGERRVA